MLPQKNRGPVWTTSGLGRLSLLAKGRERCLIDIVEDLVYQDNKLCSLLDQKETQGVKNRLFSFSCCYQ